MTKERIVQAIKKQYSRHAWTYTRTDRLIRRTESFSREQLERWQTARLKRVLTHAARQSPYYRSAFEETGADPARFSSLSDIEAYPFLTKSDYRDRIGDILSRDAFKPSLIRASTGGTTGQPVPLYRFMNDFAREKAFVDYVHRVLDMDPSCRKAIMRGPVEDSRGTFCRVGDFGQSLYVSSHSMSESNLAEYVARIRDFRPRMLYTLPSVAMVLAMFMEKHRMPPFEGMRWVFCTSENLYDFQVEYLKKVFRCRVTSFYGHSEHAVMASRCSRSDLYHVFPQYGYTEIIDEAGKPVTEEGKEGEIVSTSFSNACCHLIRYRTGDYAVFTRKTCACGREYASWTSLRGREQAVAIAKNSTRISIGPALLCTIFDKTYREIKQFQIVQDEPGKLTVKVVPHDRKQSGEIDRYFQKIFRDQFQNHFDVDIEQVIEPEFRMKSKHRYFIQNVKGFAESKGDTEDEAAPAS